MQNKNLINDALIEVQESILNISETVLTPKMREALTGLSTGKNYVSAVKHCQHVIDTDPLVDKEELASVTASKLNLNPVELYSRIRNYEASRSDEL